MINMKGQQVVVIGGTSGIDLAIAQQSEAAGAHVYIASRRQASVDAALDLLKDATGHVVDVLDPGSGSVKAFFDQVGPFDHLVYTAGEPLSMMTIADLDLDQARSFFEARYFGALNAVHIGVPHLAPGGSITLTSGTAAERPGSGWALGASVCGAMNSVTRSLAVELAPIRVNAVAPGVTRSAVWSQMSDTDRDRMYEQLGNALPLGRVAEPADAADAYLYCMTQAYTTGQVVTVDGGSVLV
jgi:NAD(P)-dependent dehydrogenase (short-subunit alcohol dehydrogenase family)